MDRQAGTDEPATHRATAPGKRLERYVKERWGRDKGGIRGLAVAIGSSAETIYSWFRGDSEPSMAHLRELADRLGVRRAVLVAVLDGDPLPGEGSLPDALEERLRAIEAELALRAPADGAARPKRSSPPEKAG